MKSFGFLSFILSSIFFFPQQTSNQGIIISLASKTETKPILNDSIRLKYLTKKSDSFFSKGVIDSALVYDRMLLKESFESNNLFYSASASSNLGYYHKEHGQKDSSFYYYNLSKNLYEQADDSLNTGKKLLSLGLLQKNASDFFGAKETLVEAISFLEWIGEKRFLASVYNELATNNKKLLNFEDAVRYYKKAIEITDSRKDETTYKNNLALVYKERGEYIRAISILSSLIRDTILNKKSNDFARILHNYTYCKWKNGKENVLDSFLLALKIRKENQDLRGLISSYTDLSEFYHSQDKNISKAYIDSLSLLAKRIKMPEGELDALIGYFKFDPNNIKYKDRYIFLRDSLYKQELKVKTQFAKMKYDDKLEKERLLALENQTIRQNIILAEEKSQKILFISLTGILLLGSICFFLIWRQRHVREKLNEVYNTEKRISEQLHDCMANDVFGLITQVQRNEHVDSEMLLQKLDNIYYQTRNISHENGAIMTGANFYWELNDLFSSYQDNDCFIILKGLDSIVWDSLQEHKCIALYRSLKELLTNMRKHSKASLVSFQFENLKNSIRISYQDNGIGINQGFQKGIGLKNTENRIRAIGGNSIFGINKNGGMKATISIPN